MPEHDPSCQVDLRPAVALFRSLGDPTRLAIVHELARGERRVVDLTRTLSLAQSTISGHLACLADCDLVASRPVGRQSFYRLTQPHLLGVLAAAEQLLAATGSAVALCPTYGTDAATGPQATSA
jgi:ArsR family transcriptional regulator, cadmium/lead-responsive transcriptional repressor